MRCTFDVLFVRLFNKINKLLYASGKSKTSLICEKHPVKTSMALFPFSDPGNNETSENRRLSIQKSKMNLILRVIFIFSTPFLHTSGNTTSNLNLKSSQIQPNVHQAFRSTSRLPTDWRQKPFWPLRNTPRATSPTTSARD